MVREYIESKRDTRPRFLLRFRGNDSNGRDGARTRRLCGPEQRVGLFEFKLRAAGYRHSTGRVDVESSRYTSQHLRSDGNTQIIVRTRGLGSTLAVAAHAEPDASRGVARFFHELLGSPDYATGIATLVADLKRNGFALLSTPDAKPLLAGNVEAALVRVPVYVAFDFDNDQELKHLLIGHAKNPDSPFDVADFSLKEAAPEKNWQDKARPKDPAIKESRRVIVGEHTHKARGALKPRSVSRGRKESHTSLFVAARSRSVRGPPGSTATSMIGHGPISRLLSSRRVPVHRYQVLLLDRRQRETAPLARVREAVRTRIQQLGLPSNTVRFIGPGGHLSPDPKSPAVAFYWGSGSSDPNEARLRAFGPRG